MTDREIFQKPVNLLLADSVSKLASSMWIQLTLIGNNILYKSANRLLILCLLKIILTSITLLNSVSQLTSTDSFLLQIETFEIGIRFLHVLKHFKNVPTIKEQTHCWI